MKKYGSLCLILICCICISFTGGFFLGRNFNHATVEISKSQAPSDSRPSDGDDEVPPGDERININTATEDQLQLLPGIGATLAHRIVEYRNMNGPFENVAQLMSVDGIGTGRLNAIVDYITVGG